MIFPPQDMLSSWVRRHDDRARLSVVGAASHATITNAVHQPAHSSDALARARLPHGVALSHRRHMPLRMQEGASRPTMDEPPQAEC